MNDWTLLLLANDRLLRSEWVYFRRCRPLELSTDLTSRDEKKSDLLHLPTR